MKFVLSEMTWREAEEAFKRTDVAIVPIGSVHSHGIVCPVAVDIMIAEELAKRLGKKTGAIVTPTISYGWTDFQMGFPGTINVGTQHLYGTTMDVFRSLHKWGIKKILIISGHGENMHILRPLIMDALREMGLFSAIVEWWMLIKELDPKYANTFYAEPAVSAAINPNLIDLKKAKMRKFIQPSFLPKALIPITHMKVRFGKGTIDVSLNARDVEGEGEPFDQKIVNVMAKEGEEILNIVTDYLADLVQELRQIKI